ncbi:MAG: ABC transporter ATP-binding protein [Synergistaceae bacterium]|nr:ABC transporter ATP-binding protein [Synergistaceae bacterium]
MNSSGSLLALENFAIFSGIASRYIVRDVNLSVPAAAPFCLAGESGCGKSLLAQAIVGSLPDELEAEGSIFLAGDAISELPRKQIRELWGRKIFYMPQEPSSSLDPSMRIREQILEIHTRVMGKPRKEGLSQVRRMLETLGLDSVTAGKEYPLRLSGGMNQRALLAMALSSPAELIIVDEPTKGMESAKRDEVIFLLSKLAEEGRTMFCITHDLEIPRRLGGMLAMMYAGLIVEVGPSREVLSSPRHTYTRSFLRALPENGLNPIPEFVLNSLDTAWGKENSRKSDWQGENWKEARR